MGSYRKSEFTLSEAVIVLVMLAVLVPIILAADIGFWGLITWALLWAANVFGADIEITWMRLIAGGVIGFIATLFPRNAFGRSKES